MLTFVAVYHIVLASLVSLIDINKRGRTVRAPVILKERPHCLIYHLHLYKNLSSAMSRIIT